MRYKPMAATRQHTIHIPRLDGGLNLNDVPSTAEHNQITDCRNLWWHRGALRPRPGFQSIGACLGDFNFTQPIGEGEMIFISYQLDEKGNRRLYAVLVNTEGTKMHCGTVLDEYLTLPPAAGAPMTVFACHAPRGAQYDMLFYLGSGEIVSYDAASHSWGSVTPYIPHISTDGIPTAERRAGSPAGTTLEYGNLLSNSCICTYTTNGVGTYYYLPAVCRGASLRLRLAMYDPDAQDIITFDPTVSRRFSAAAFDLDPAKYQSVTLGYQYYASRGIFRLYGTATLANNSTQIVPLPADERNNLTVTATGFTGYNPARICRMTIGTWFGGDHSGGNGGLRLFLSGDSSAPNLMHWSHIDNPLYFPQNNYAYVGDSGSPITAFGKQSDLLILFKKQEIFYMEYDAKSDSAADTVPSDSATANANRPCFQLTPLHATIGCDCPATLRLVNNKLVWMTSGGQLYMLPAVNRNGETNVREISSMIAPALAAHSQEELLAAASGEYYGRYLLLIGRSIYLLDCRNAAFNGSGQYTNEANALRALVYYRWETPFDSAYQMISGGGKLVLVDKNPHYTVGYRTLMGDRDGIDPIPVSFTTKMYSGADPTRRISVPQVYLSISDSEHPIRITYHTDSDDHIDAATLIGNAVTPDDRHIRPRRLTPHVHHAARFGFTCESNSGFAVTDITIITRTDGTIH